MESVMWVIAGIGLLTLIVVLTLIIQVERKTRGGTKTSQQSFEEFTED